MHKCSIFAKAGTYVRTYVHMYVHTMPYIHTYMCHGAGAKVGWIKEYRGLTFTM